MDTKATASEVIDRLGGTAAVAKLCEIKAPSVSEWRRNGIPRPWLKFLQLAKPEAFQASNRKQRHMRSEDNEVV